MISEKLIEEAMAGRFDGIDACDIAREVLELEAQIKAKNDALEEIRVNTGRDTTPTQWIVRRAEQGLEGGD